jgi:hypothetical protein
VFAAQHYAHDLVLATSQRRSSVLPRSHKDAARKAFERVTKAVLPASYAQLQRALDREARAYAKQQDELIKLASQQHVASSADEDVTDDSPGAEAGAED